jgi:hypothetical protein
MPLSCRRRSYRWTCFQCGIYNAYPILDLQSIQYNPPYESDAYFRAYAADTDPDAEHVAGLARGLYDPRASGVQQLTMVAPSAKARLLTTAAATGAVVPAAAAPGHSLARSAASVAASSSSSALALALPTVPLTPATGHEANDPAFAVPPLGPHYTTVPGYFTARAAAQAAGGLGGGRPAKAAVNSSLLRSLAISVDRGPGGGSEDGGGGSGVSDISDTEAQGMRGRRNADAVALVNACMADGVSPEATPNPLAAESAAHVSL